MDAALGALRIVAALFAVVGVTLGMHVRGVARIAAQSAATAAATAAADSLRARTVWDCSSSGDAWDVARAAAARAVTARARELSAVTPVRMTLSASTGCVVIASVTVSAAGARSSMDVSALACRPAGAANAVGWSESPAC